MALAIGASCSGDNIIGAQVLSRLAWASSYGVDLKVIRSTKRGQPQCANTCEPLPASYLLCSISESKSHGQGQMQCRRELFQGMETKRHGQVVGHSCSNLPHWLHSRCTTDIGNSSFCIYLLWLLKLCDHVAPKSYFSVAGATNMVWPWLNKFLSMFMAQILATWAQSHSSSTEPEPRFLDCKCTHFLLHWTASPQNVLKALHLSLKPHTGSQSSLNEVIQSLAAMKSFKAEQTQCFLYMALDTLKKLIPSLLDIKNLPPGDGKPKSM